MPPKTPNFFDSLFVQPDDVEPEHWIEQAEQMLASNFQPRDYREAHLINIIDGLLQIVKGEQ